MKKLLFLAIIVLPWSIKRIILQRWLGYQLHRTARIGLAWIFPKHLVMGPSSRIDHFSVAIHLDRLELGESSKIGRGNWITGFPKNNPNHFQHISGRRPELVVGTQSAITKNHHLDCTERILIGDFVTIAGYGSQFLTHSIDVIANRQDARPITIGDYCFIGTDSVVLGGAVLPPSSVLGAKSLLSKEYTESHQLYAGVPARRIKSLPNDAKYFTRETGFVN
ncbi:hypothetical protein [Novipirellula sp.]|uniref:acyltransferase n=1 Tax=Novipirellula sp. TaxID=2795430 RepID=UPI00356A5191